MFWNSGGEIFFMLLGFIADLFDLRSKLNVLCNSANGLTVSLAMSAKFFPSLAFS
jgi:hypothetical protein